MTAKSMKENLKMTKDRVKECSPGEMEEYMTVNGKMESSMEEEPSLKSMAQERWECGKTEEIFAGSTTTTIKWREIPLQESKPKEQQPIEDT